MKGRMSREEYERFVEEAERRQDELLRLIEKKRAERDAELAARERPRRRRFLGLI
jgi:hypothetical protein